MNKAIFIDKDGTLIPDIPYNIDPELIKVDQSIKSALRQAKEIGYMLILVSNQSGIARGYFTERDLIPALEKIQRELKVEDVQLDDVFFCPHHPKGIIKEYAVECDCRKPMPGMIVNAALKHNIDLKKSWMVGDILNDVEAGTRAGCKTILVDNGNETEWIKSEFRTPSKVVSSLTEAVDFILEKSDYEST
jgi:D-glycero-D-manno-heptose 1,7-bisphosphate phosphatase